MELYKNKVKITLKYLYVFIKWILMSGIVGLTGGIIGVMFYKAVEYATGMRENNTWLIFLLPVGGIAIIALYKTCKTDENTGTNQIISSIRSNDKVPVMLAPLIFVSTAITHLLGGSAGREGAALQIGGDIGYQAGRLFRLDQKDMHLIILCGMSSVFSALFGTPLTAMLFAMEVVSVGIIYYSALVPCLFSSLTAYGISLLFKIKPVHYTLSAVPAVSVMNIAKTVVLAASCAAVSIVFCYALHMSHRLMKKMIKNSYIRIIAGGFIIIALTLLVQTRDYNGAGTDVIARAIGGNAKPEAFLLKMIFTAVTIAAGYRGGEIVPTFFIGATLGCVMGHILNMDPGFCAAVGFIALFCGMVNCPISSILLSIEVFGSSGIILFAIACCVTYMLSGNYSLYSSQKIVYSKLKAEYINEYTK